MEGFDERGIPKIFLRAFEDIVQDSNSGETRISKSESSFSKNDVKPPTDDNYLDGGISTGSLNFNTTKPSDRTDIW